MISTETRVGIFVVLGVLIFGGMILGYSTIGKNIGSEAISIYVKTNSAKGVFRGARVYYHGIDVGSVREITFDGNSVVVRVGVEPLDAPIPNNITVRIKTDSLLGFKYVDILRDPDRPATGVLKDGDFYSDSTVDFDLDHIEAKITNIVNSMDSISAALNTTLIDGRVLDNIVNITEQSRNIADRLNSAADQIPTFIAQMDLLVNRISYLVDNIDNGDGVIPALINDDNLTVQLKNTVQAINDTIQLYSSTKFFMGLEAGLYTNFQEQNIYDDNFGTHYRGSVSLAIAPNPNKFYKFGLSAGTSFSEEIRNKTVITKDALGNIISAEEISSVEQISNATTQIKLSALYGLRFFDQRLTVQGGLMESSAGLGVAYSFPQWNFDVETNVWDIGGGRRTLPRVATGFNYYVKNIFYITAGIDDYVDKDRPLMYLGIGTVVWDRDLGKAISFLPLATAF